MLAATLADAAVVSEGFVVTVSGGSPGDIDIAAAAATAGRGGWC